MSVAETVDPFTAVFGDQVKQRERVVVREAVSARIFVCLGRKTEPCYDILVDLTAVDHLERQSPARLANRAGRAFVGQ